MKLNVPEPVAAYLAAEAAKDVEKLALCFTDDGVSPPFVKNCTLSREPEVTTAPELL
jgi:hypothetical protein